MTVICCQKLKDIEERLSDCTVCENELSAVHLFIKECSSNISEDNIHREAEVEQWEILKAEGANGITFETDPIYLCSDSAVVELQIKLMEEERDENIIDVYEQIEWDLIEQLKEIDAYLNQLEQDKLESKKSIQQALGKYEEDSENTFIANSKFISDLKSPNGRTASKFGKMLDQCLCESPLTALKEKFHCFLETFTSHLRNYFLEAAETDGVERCRNLVVGQRKLEESLSATLYENYVLESKVKGLEAALSNIKGMTGITGNGVKMSLKTDIQTELVTLKNIKRAEDIIVDFKNDLNSLSRMAANVIILKHILNMCSSKYNRLSYWWSQTEKWTTFVISEKKLINDVLDILHSEKKATTKVMSTLTDFETYLKTEHNSSTCRTAMMQAQLQNPIENDVLYNVLVNILGLFTIDKSISTRLSWKQLEEAVISIKKRNVSKKEKFLKSFEENRCILFGNDCLFKLITGPKIESGLNYSLIDIEAHQETLINYEKAHCAIDTDFLEKQKILSTNYFLKHRRLLWVYILCNKEKLAEVLSYVNECLSEASK